MKNILLASSGTVEGILKIIEGYFYLKPGSLSLVPVSGNPQAFTLSRTDGSDRTIRRSWFPAKNPGSVSNK